MLASAGLTGTLVCATGWWWEARRPGISPELLSAGERESLARELLATSPGVFRPALFNPLVGYTLKPGHEFAEWGSRFTSNELGFRAGPVTKPAGVIRVVFVGDSWAFGLGVDEEQAFPRQLERLAPSPGTVEAWSLALPGYNAANQVAAIDSLFDTLAPDVVVLCPTNNDVDSGHQVLPNGSLGSALMLKDEFDLPVPVAFRSVFMNSHLFLSRWHSAVSLWAALVDRFESRGIPVVIFFTGRWIESFAHRLIEMGEIDCPYVVTPDELSSVAWRNPAPFFHPNPAAHREYARLLYPALAPFLGWPPHGVDPSRWKAPVHRRGSWSQDRARTSDADLQQQVDRIVRSEFVPDRKYVNQCGGGLDLGTGLMGRGAVVFLRRAPGAQRLVIRAERLPGVSFLYPLALSVTVPSAGGGARHELVVGSSGPQQQRFSVELPHDIPAGVTVDVVMCAERVTVTGVDLSPRTLRLLSITQEE